MSKLLCVVAKDGFVFYNLWECIDLNSPTTDSGFGEEEQWMVLSQKIFGKVNDEVKILFG